MRFKNPNFEEEKKLNNKVETSEINKKDNQYIKQNEEQLIYLDELLKTEETNKVEIKYIDYPKNAIILGVPKSIELSTNQMGIETIKYENSFSNVNKMM